jgi:hypothetical protein
MLHQLQDEHHIRKLLTSILLGLGKIWISRDENKVPTGMIIAMKNGSIWNPAIVFYSELAYWVQPEYRGGLSGYKLLKSYTDYCQHQLITNDIAYYTASKMSTSPDINYHRMGFQKLEETWMRKE